MATVKPVVFRLNEGYYGIDINKVIAIEQLGDVVPVPNAVDNVEGLINIRGDIIPVYNLKTKNKQKDEKSDEIRDYILVRCNESQIALSVDSVEDIQDETEYHKLPVICSDEECILSRLKIKNERATPPIIAAPPGIAKSAMTFVSL